MEKRRPDPTQKKNRDRRKKREKKIHRVGEDIRAAVKQDLRRLISGDITEEEFRAAHGEDEQI